MKELNLMINREDLCMENKIVSVQIYVQFQIKIEKETEEENLER